MFAIDTNIFDFHFGFISDSYCCWLKTDVPKMEPHEACVSGIIKREHYKSPPTGMRSSVPLGGLGTGSFEMRADGKYDIMEPFTMVCKQRSAYKYERPTVCI